MRVLILRVEGREENLGTGETANQIRASRYARSLAHRSMGVVNVRVRADLNFGGGRKFESTSRYMNLPEIQKAWRWCLTQLIWRHRVKSLGLRSRLERPLMICGARFIQIGDQTLIRQMARLEVIRRRGTSWSPNLRIGNRVNIEQGVHIICQSEVVIEDEVSIAPYCGIFDTAHPNDPPDVGPKIGDRLSDEFLPVRIGKGSLIGMHVVILPNVAIGKGCVIGAGSVVTRSVPDYCVAVGAPAKIVKRYDCEKRIWIAGEDNSELTGK